MQYLAKLNRLTTYLFYFFVFLLPWQTRWILVDAEIPFQQLSLYASDIILIMIFALILIFNFKFLISKQFSKFQLQNHKSSLFPAFCLLFLILGFASIIWSQNSELALYWSIRLVLALGLFWLVKKINFNWRTLAWVLLIAISLQALIGLGQFILQDDLVVTKWLGAAAQEAQTSGTSVIETSEGRFLRAHGTQPHPNILGGLLVTGLILTLYLFRSTKEKFKTTKLSLVLVIIYCLLLTTLIFTFSRSAWIALLIFGVVSLINVIYKKRLSWRTLLFFLTTLLIIAVPVLLYWSVVKNRFSTQPRLENRAIAERLSSFDQAESIIGQNLTLGTGLGNYTLVVQENFPELEAYQIQPAHMAFMLILAELGLIGLMLFLFVLARATNLKRPTDKPWIFILGALIIMSAFDHYIWTLPSMFYLFWLVMALVATSQPQAFDEKVKANYN